MAFWIWHRESADTPGRYLEIPWEGIPDLTGVQAMSALKALLKTLRPEDPPEAITREAERMALFRFELMRDDVLVVPVGEELRFAVVEKKYVYHEGKHTVAVRWLEETAPRHRFKKFPRIQESKPGIYSVGDAALRDRLRNYLPKAYRRRFGKWLWLLGVLFLLKLVYLAVRFL